VDLRRRRNPGKTLLARTDASAGCVHVHFPGIVFQGQGGGLSQTRVDSGDAMPVALAAVLGGLLSGCDSAVIDGAMPGLQKRFGAPSAGTGLTVASMLLGCAVGALSAGRLANKRGRRWMQVLSTLHPLQKGRGRAFEHMPACSARAMGRQAPALSIHAPLVRLALLGAIGASFGAAAQQASPNQGLLGDWGGERTRLYQRGIDFQLSYFAEPAYNLRGGSEKLLRSADQFVVGSTLDLDKLWAWPKAKLQLTLTNRNGKNLSDEADLGTLMQVQQVFGRGSIVRLTELSYQQSFLGDTLDLKLGRLGVGADFFPWSCVYMNLSFCGSLPGNIVSNWINWPVSQWAGRVKVAFAPEWDVKVGVYQINPSYLENQYGLTLRSPPGTIGALFPVELTWSPKFGPLRLPGTYRVGAWLDNAKQPDVFLAANGQPRVLNPGLPPLQQNGEHGYYLNFQQQLAAAGGGSSRGVSLFANYVHADPDTATLSQIVSLGLIVAGPFDARPKDTLGVAAGWTKVNPSVTEGQRLLNSAGQSPPLPLQNAEYPVELFYSFVATPWLTLGPALQYIYRPGGTSANPNVVVIGLNFGLVF